MIFYSQIYFIYILYFIFRYNLHTCSMTSKKNTLLSFFTSNKKIRRENENNETEVNSPVRKITEVNKSAGTALSLESFSEASNSQSQQDDLICENNQMLGNANDIGYFVECLSLIDADKKLTRLNGLALLACHTETKITPDEVIDELSLKNRRLEFVL